jgi:hypothetical protein
MDISIILLRGGSILRWVGGANEFNMVFRNK